MHNPGEVTAGEGGGKNGDIVGDIKMAHAAQTKSQEVSAVKSDFAVLFCNVSEQNLSGFKRAILEERDFTLCRIL